MKNDSKPKNDIKAIGKIMEESTGFLLAQAEGTDPLTMNARAETKERQWHCRDRSRAVPTMKKKFIATNEIKSVFIMSNVNRKL